ncbi:MAG TPA: hypothetical protein VN823_16405 [Stellaceae bacterium]|nr:hypothetical protein [Stellaceae bacterium]
MSYAATGKSVSDHGISAAVGEDCALWRVLADRKICTDPGEPSAPAVADATRDLPKASTPAETGTKKPIPAPAQELASVPETRRFLVLGSFINQDNAKHLAASLDGIETAVVAVGMDGAIFHRVIAGPLDDAGIKALSERMVLEAGVRPWEITEPAGEAPAIGSLAATAATPDATALLGRRAIAPPPI